MYYDMLEAHENESKWGIRTRVVIDIVAGTSAGGINGIVLAKALARSLDQDAGDRVWLDDGDLKQLMRSKPLRRCRTRSARPARGSAPRCSRVHAAAHGDLLLELVHKALARWTRRARSPAPGEPATTRSSCT